MLWWGKCLFNAIFPHEIFELLTRILWTAIAYYGIYGNQEIVIGFQVMLLLRPNLIFHKLLTIAQSTAGP